MKITTIKSKQIRDKYQSFEEALKDLIPNWTHPLCNICKIELSDLGTLFFEDDEYRHELPKRKCCCVGECPSAKIKFGTDEYRIVVTGKDPDELRLEKIERFKKVVETTRARGYYEPDNNPMSKKRLKNEGMSDEDIDLFMKSKGQKAVSTKRDSGFYDDKSNNPYSIEYWIKTGLSEDDAKLKIRNKNHNCKEYWTSRGFENDEAERKASKSADTNSLDAKIIRHGEDVGNKKYKDTCDLLSSSWTMKSVGHWNFGTSKAACELFDNISNLTNEKCFYKSEFSKINKEWYLSDENGINFYDFTIPNLKIIIEFNGEHVHPRKDKLTKDKWNSWKHAFSKKNADAIHIQDQEKIHKAIINGYNVLVLWSKDDKLTNIEIATNFIREVQNARL